MKGEDPSGCGGRGETKCVRFKKSKRYPSGGVQKAAGSHGGNLLRRLTRSWRTVGKAERFLNHYIFG